MDWDLIAGTSKKGIYFVAAGEEPRLVTNWSVYGITWNEDYLFLGETRFEGFGSVWRWSKDLERLDAVRKPVHDVHQVLWKDGWLYITDTGNDKLIRWDGKRFETVYDASGSGEDQNHLNSVWLCDDFIWLVEHRRSLKPGRVRILNRKNHELHRTLEFQDVSEEHVGLHNVYVEDGHVYVLAVGKIIDYDLGDDAVVGERELGGYLRGLARGDGFWCVGQSLLGDRAEREGGDGHVFILDDDWDVMDEIRLPEAGQVVSVRFLRGDRAHNGLPFPGELLP